GRAAEDSRRRKRLAWRRPNVESPGPAQHRDRRAARRFARRRSGHGPEDRRLPHRARCVHLRRGAGRDSRHRPCAHRPAAGAGRSVTARPFGLPAHWLAASLCLGLAAANALRVVSPVLLALAVALATASALVGSARLALLAPALFPTGLWWGGLRPDALDRSPLLAQVGRAELARVVVPGPPRQGRFEVRVPARVLRFGRLEAAEPILLELPR